MPIKIGERGLRRNIGIDIQIDKKYGSLQGASEEFPMSVDNKLGFHKDGFFGLFCYQGTEMLVDGMRIQLAVRSPKSGSYFRTYEISLR